MPCVIGGRETTLRLIDEKLPKFRSPNKPELDQRCSIRHSGLKTDLPRSAPPLAPSLPHGTTTPRALRVGQRLCQTVGMGREISRMRRFVIEMGMGNDLHGGDYTKAAGRAIEAALRRSTLPLFEGLGIDHAAMEVRVTVAVTAPDQVDCAALESRLPRGRASVRAVAGGLDVTNPDTGEVGIVATAAVEAFLDEDLARSAIRQG